MTNRISDDPVAPILSALASILQEAGGLAREAHHANRAGERNQAIGTVLYLDDLLKSARALFDTAIIMHRRRDRDGAA